MSHNKKNRNKMIVTLADGTKILRRKPKSSVNRKVACKFDGKEYICSIEKDSKQRQCAFQGLFPNHDKDGKIVGFRIDCKKFNIIPDSTDEKFYTGICSHETAKKYAHDEYVNIPPEMVCLDEMSDNEVSNG